MTQDSIPAHMRQPTQGPARVLLAAPTRADIEAVTDLLRAYVPNRLVTSVGLDASLVETCARALGVEWDELDSDMDAPSTLDALAEAALGATIALLVPFEALPRMVTHALGVADAAAARFEFASSAISVLECDADGRWAVLRVNEGAWPAGHS